MTPTLPSESLRTSQENAPLLRNLIRIAMNMWRRWLKAMQNLRQLKELLSKCEHVELRDPAFGDSEHDWFFEGKQVAYGYMGNESKSITIAESGQIITDSAIINILLDCHSTYRSELN